MFKKEHPEYVVNAILGAGVKSGRGFYTYPDPAHARPVLDRSSL
jgi:hypothetical protein